MLSVSYLRFERSQSVKLFKTSELCLLDLEEEDSAYFETSITTNLYGVTLQKYRAFGDYFLRGILLPAARQIVSSPIQASTIHD